MGGPSDFASWSYTGANVQVCVALEGHKQGGKRTFHASSSDGAPTVPVRQHIGLGGGGRHFDAWIITVCWPAAGLSIYLRVRVKAPKCCQNFVLIYFLLFIYNPGGLAMVWCEFSAHVGHKKAWNQENPRKTTKNTFSQNKYKSLSFLTKLIASGALENIIKAKKIIKFRSQTPQKWAKNELALWRRWR